MDIDVARNEVHTDFVTGEEVEAEQALEAKPGRKGIDENSQSVALDTSRAHPIQSHGLDR